MWLTPAAFLGGIDVCNACTVGLEGVYGSGRFLSPTW